MKDKYPDVIEKIRTTKTLDKDAEEVLKKASSEFVAKFKAGA